MTKSVVEVVILTLNKASTTKELSSNKLHQSCLDTVRAAEGCRQVTWGVTQEDDRKLVWLVGEQSKTFNCPCHTYELNSDYIGRMEQSGRSYARFREILSLSAIQARSVVYDAD